MAKNKIRPPKDLTPNTFKNVTNSVPNEYEDELTLYLTRRKNYYMKQMKEVFDEARVTTSLSINKVRTRYYKHKEVINLRVNKKYTTLTEFIDKCLPIVNEAAHNITKRFPTDKILLVNFDTTIGRDDYVMKCKIIAEIYNRIILPDVVIDRSDEE